MRNDFLCNENENFLRQHCSPFQDARLYIIWTYLNKLFVIWPESHESSFMVAHFREHLFKIFVVFQVSYFPSKQIVVYLKIIKKNQEQTTRQLEVPVNFAGSGSDLNYDCRIVWS